MKKSLSGIKFKEKVSSFFSDNTISATLDNILAMFPSTILMPLLINAAVGFEIFDISLVLCVSGIATFAFLLFSQGRLPGYLGSSFSFIGITTYVAAMLENDTVTKADISGYIMGAYICVAGYMLILAVVCKIADSGKEKKAMNFIKKIIPASVMGPAISLIGLELSGQAVVQSGLNMEFSTNSLLALITIALIIILSVTRRPVFQKSSIFLGVVLAGIVAIAMNKWDFTTVLSAPFFRVPDFSLVVPRFSFNIALMVLPPTLIVFSEHLARKMTTEGLIKSYLLRKPTVAIKPVSLFRSVAGNALATGISAFCGSVPVTLYAENIAVMRINNDPRPNQFYLASVVVVLLSFSGNLLALIRSIPEPVLGGLSMVLMGIIAAPGIQMLVDERVDYSKITNLFLTASVLIVGLSDMSIKILGTEFTGMSLGLLVGIVLNLLFKLLGLLNISREHLGFEEIIAYCKKLDKGVDIESRTFDLDSEVEFSYKGVVFVKISNDFDNLRLTIYVPEGDDECLVKYRSKKVDDKIAIVVDGFFKDKELKDMIQTSLNIVKGMALGPGKPPAEVAEPTEGAETKEETAEATTETAETKGETVEAKTESAEAKEGTDKPAEETAEVKEGAEEAKKEPAEPKGKTAKPKDEPAESDQKPADVKSETE